VNASARTTTAMTTYTSWGPPEDEVMRGVVT
jgi:hypothetical protein